LVCESLTHLAISRAWVGEPLELGPGTAIARLLTCKEMAADERGLVHGGFAFGLADYAAMLAVNDPYVVLGAAETRFLAPVRVGEVLTARAVVESVEGKKRLVKCTVTTDREVLAATFTCFVLPMHVFDV
jgi:acyl-coenzyme A thioesterase PaaI-like protein